MNTNNYFEDAPLPSMSESQIMTTLNSSIEDLLSKISKVQQEYESSTRVLHPRSLKSLENHQTISSQKETKSVSSIADTFTSSSASKLAVIQDTCWKQNRKPLDSHRFDSLGCVAMDSNMLPEFVNRSTSLKEVQEQSQQHFYALKNTKIHSLFNHPSIRELQASQIISTQPNQENHSSILLGTKQVQEIMVNSYIDSPSNNRIFGQLSLRDFQVGPTVGSGKFGDIYMCRHKQSGFLFALKKIFKSTIQEYRMQAQFCLELKLLYLLDHPNIVKLYGHFSDEYHIFLLMEYIEGGELLKKLGSEERYVSKIMQTLLQTVEHLHNHSIIHRDIKPENVVLAFDTPKLCDFGWATSCNHNIMKQTFCGTADYLSPQMKNGESYTFSVDIWSLGVLVYELITGSAPFKEQIGHWKRKGGDYRWNWAISYPPSVSALAENFMKHLLRENPDERASLRTCRNHYFIKKYKQFSSEIIKQLNF